MYLDIVEGATDKSESGLREILVSQAKLRVFIAAPVVVIETILYLLSPDNIAGRLAALTACYCAYILSLHVLVRYQPAIPSRYLLLATAVFDQRGKRPVPNPQPFGPVEDDPSHQLASRIFARGPRA